MLLMVMWILAAAMAGLTVYAAHHLGKLPDAPDCPTCRCVTSHSARTSRVDRVLARYGGADARQCPRCGWTGRMRWRLAAERARRD
jgi:hypothetical protein